MTKHTINYEPLEPEESDKQHEKTVTGDDQRPTLADGSPRLRYQSDLPPEKMKFISKEKGEVQLREQTGAFYNETLSKAQIVVRTCADEQTLADLERTGLGNHPEVIKRLAGLQEIAKDESQLKVMFSTIVKNFKDDLVKKYGPEEGWNNE